MELGEDGEVVLERPAGVDVEAVVDSDEDKTAEVDVDAELVPDPLPAVVDVLAPSSTHTRTQYAYPANILAQVGGSTEGFHSMNSSTEIPKRCATV